MAAIVTALKATPHSLVLSIAGNDGAANALAWAGTGGIKDLVVPGPLATLLKQLATATVPALDTLNLDGANSGKVRARIVTGVSTNPTMPTAQNIHWTTTGLSLQVAAGDTTYVEFRLQHSLDR